MDFSISLLISSNFKPKFCRTTEPTHSLSTINAKSKFEMNRFFEYTIEQNKDFQKNVNIAMSKFFKWDNARMLFMINSEYVEYDLVNQDSTSEQLKRCVKYLPYDVIQEVAKFL